MAYHALYSRNTPTQDEVVDIYGLRLSGQHPPSGPIPSEVKQSHCLGPLVVLQLSRTFSKELESRVLVKYSLWSCTWPYKVVWWTGRECFSTVPMPASHHAAKLRLSYGSIFRHVETEIHQLFDVDSIHTQNMRLIHRCPRCPSDGSLLTFAPFESAINVANSTMTTQRSVLPN